MTLKPAMEKEIVSYKGAATASAISAALRRAARKAGTPSGIVLGGGGFRARRADRYFWLGFIVSFLAIVVVPIMVSATYFGLIQSNQYVTETRLSLKSKESSIADALSAAVGLTSSDTAQMAAIVVSYIKSRSMVDAVNQKIDLPKLFSDPSIDYFSRYDSTEPREVLVKFWDRQVDASVDKTSGLITLVVRTFTPESSLDLTRLIIAKGESLVNSISDRLRQDTLAVTKRELERSQENLRRATAAMRDMRNAEGILDAGAAGDALQTVINALQLERSKVQQQYTVQGGSLDRDAPTMRLLAARIKFLDQQIDSYIGLIASRTGSSQTVVDKMSKLTTQKVELGLAEKKYGAAVAEYEAARLNLETQHYYLVPFLKPTLPEKSLYPRRLWNFCLASLAVIAIWGLGASCAFLIRDHMSM